MHRITAHGKRLFKKSVWVCLLFFSCPAGFEMMDGYAATPMASLRNMPFLSDTATSGAFSALTYNIAGLPEFISSAVTRRAPSIAEIGRRLNAFDIVNVQEDFNYNQYLYNSGNTHPFRTQTKGIVPFGDGLNTLSKYPVSQIRRIAWTNCTGADCLTPKGFTYSRLEIGRNLFVDLYNVHANAYNHLAAAAARRENLKQLSSFIKSNSNGKAVIIMGDLNAHYSYYYDNLRKFLADNDLKDSWASLTRNGNLPVSSKALPENDILSIGVDSESIDKILYRSSREISLEPSQYNLEKQPFQNEKGLPLSDHYPVSVRFNWNLAMPH